MIKQSTPEWLEWRRNGIGASDAAIIMGISPWKTPHQLWLEKTNRVPIPNMSEAMAYGHKMEEEIRQIYEEFSGDIFPPKCVSHPERLWQRASLDGISFDGKIILEIKTCSKKVFSEAKKGEVPEYYMVQLQHQLMCVPEAEQAVIVFWNSGEWTHINVQPNTNIQDRILDFESSFYHDCILKDEPPILSEKDYLFIENNAEFEQIANEWKALHKQLEILKQKEKSARERLLELTDDGNCKGYGVSISRIYRKGSVDYSKIPELKGVDLEKYRKGSIAYTRLKTYEES